MLNYRNLNDIEFEYLCQDIMQQKLGVELHRFAAGKDGGIDLADDVDTKNIIIQVKHYMRSTVAQLIASLRRELAKVQTLNPHQYYICCSTELTPQKVQEIYSIFSEYMDSPSNIITLNEIDDFLNKDDNIEILKKHYKLWIESTGILQNIANNDLFVDCEALLSNIHKDEKLFVQTSAYYKSLNCLENNKTLFITGNPGVGKTITSKMLVLYYAANGYKVRYTTNTSDLQVLKKSLAQNAKTKEIILIDDCFGQAYFQMKDSQNNELLSLIKYVNMSTNKRLVLNSRVTIFQEAKERNMELVKSFENDEYRVFIIDMTAMSDIEKAKIFYNHLSFNKIKNEYFEEIKKDRRYRKIINHPNYNPRLVEFICNPKRYAKIGPEQYYPFIVQHLENPKEIWKDEYERKLQKTDRLLLSTIYSFSDSATDLEIIKECFEKRLSLETDVDITINQFEASLNRLLDGFVVIIDNGKSKKLSMANPSINDYLDGHFKENSMEKQALIRNATHIEQVRRLMINNEFEKWGKTSTEKHTIDTYVFRDNKHKDATIVYFICKNTILDSYYAKTIFSFLSNPSDIYHNGRVETHAEEIVKILFNNKSVYTFYKVLEFLNSGDNLTDLLSFFDLDSLPKLLLDISELFQEPYRDGFVATSINAVKIAIEDYCDDVDADDYDPDVSGAVGMATSFEEYGPEVDEYYAAQQIEVEVSDAVESEIYDKIKCLPEDIIIPNSYISDLSISVHGADHLVSSYLEDVDIEYEYHEPQATNNDFEIDLIFQRDCE